MENSSPFSQHTPTSLPLHTSKKKQKKTLFYFMVFSILHRDGVLCCEQNLKNKDGGLRMTTLSPAAGEPQVLLGIGTFCSSVFSCAKKAIHSRGSFRPRPALLVYNSRDWESLRPSRLWFVLFCFVLFFLAHCCHPVDYFLKCFLFFFFFFFLQITSGKRKRNLLGLALQV